MSKFSMRLAAIIAASTVSVAGAGFAAPALAQTTSEAGAEATPGAAANADLVDANHEIELIINKRLGDPGATDTTALGGITFRVEKVNNVDLTTQEGWAAAANLTAATATDVTEVGTIETNEQGTASMTTANTPEFTVGLYKITEVQSGNYTAAAPFLVALPHSEDGKWSYTQTVSPKNQQVNPSKQVDDTNATIGSDLRYTINAPVPAGELTRFNIVDPLNPNLSLKADGITVEAQGAEALTLTKGTDYTVDTANNTLRIEFTQDGRTKLQNARKSDPTLKVVAGFDATIVSIPSDTGQITNKATIELPNNATVDTNGDDPTTPDVTEDNPTSTTFGNLTITKTSTNGDDPLAGAEFELYQCKVSDQDSTKYELLGDASTVATTQTGSPSTKLITSGGDNRSSTAQGYGVPISSFAANTGTTNNDYCVLETKAPEGYVRNPEPQHVTIDVNARTLAVSVENQKNNIINQLPATGAWGIVLVFLVGLLLLARGLYTSYKDNRAQA